MLGEGPLRKSQKKALLCSKYTYGKDFAAEKIYRMSIFV